MRDDVLTYRAPPNTTVQAAGGLMSTGAKNMHELQTALQEIIQQFANANESFVSALTEYQHAYSIFNPTVRTFDVAFNSYNKLLRECHRLRQELERQDAQNSKLSQQLQATEEAVLKEE